MALEKVEIKDLMINSMTMIGDEWMLITAGNEETGANTMTASWGHLGSIWGGYSATIYVRPQRYTKKFVDESEYFTLCVFDDSFKKELGYLGRVSGRDEDKIKEAKLTPVYEYGTTYFAQAKLVLVCKKVYQDSIKKECFVNQATVDTYYPKKDFHDMYIGEIVAALVQK